MLKDAIEEYGVYSNEKLRSLIYELEDKYNVTDNVEFFNDLVNFSKNKNIPYHGWFKYREGFSHTLIDYLIDKNRIGDKEYVLDPFCGCGTTLVEAALNGVSGMGIDVNPMSAFVSKVKCESYSDDEIKNIKETISNFKEKISSIEITTEYDEKYDSVKKYFSSRNYCLLLNVKKYIDDLKNKADKKIYNLFLCAYFCIIEEVSDRKRDGNGLKKQISKVEDVYDYYAKQLNIMLYDIENNRISKKVESIIVPGNAMYLSDAVERNKSFINKKMAAIIYSPPYANSFDYFESYKLEVVLGDYAKNISEIREYREQAVESFIGRKNERIQVRDFIKDMAEEIENAIPEKEKRTGKRDSRTRKVPQMIQGYFTDMEKVISESSKVLSKGKKCCIIVDQSAYLGRIVPTDLFLARIAEEYNFGVEEIVVCRNAKTSGQQIQLYPYLKDSLRESMVVLYKK